MYFYFSPMQKTTPPIRPRNPVCVTSAAQTCPLDSQGFAFLLVFSRGDPLKVRIVAS
jgi:hypothetical protein